MSYWGSTAEDCDFAFDHVGAYFFTLKQRMMKDIEVVLAKSYPEQSMIASLVCLRLLGERFPKNLSVHFQRTDFEHVKRSFEEWYVKVADKLPAKHRAGILEEATREFALFEERFIKKKS